MDLISRQAAIEIVDFECGGELIGTAKIITKRLSDLPPAHPETYKEKLNEIASALSEKFAYMNTCLNERDIILGYLGVKRRCEIHCNTDCTNTKCESHPLSSAQPEHNPDDERKIADLHKMVNYLLSQPEQRWIPVTERLPEDEYVLISKKPTKISGDKWSVAMAIRTADPRSGIIQWRDSGFGIIQDDKVLAWMPLPEPYRKEGETDG